MDALLMMKEDNLNEALLASMKKNPAMRAASDAASAAAAAGDVEALKRLAMVSLPDLLAEIRRVGFDMASLQPVLDHLQVASNNVPQEFKSNLPDEEFGRTFYKIMLELFKYRDIVNNNESISDELLENLQEQARANVTQEAREKLVDIMAAKTANLERLTALKAKRDALLAQEAEYDAELTAIRETQAALQKEAMDLLAKKAALEAALLEE
mmetsp:Transcript_15400/g.31133  ORF Transcript_15400/g.31133 Transcript_15400/m.31133 type:complete len:212 (+) Transcript_15400:49-684(+)|eukprot:CAMPEP_0119056160 /NCGR_PEP_ID=MMETSP1178-20130426/864_1 /TAXON_ID=33656 /ORGANISM="unid sp, Strain CCMP2000" /LENGTH=211 /DNA_ID=CAMNT_0007036861 /DNA_START=49 /DNA_END=684 /DNA_ORIENTATION=-